jgi:hypothetical protein
VKLFKFKLHTKTSFIFQPIKVLGKICILFCFNMSLKINVPHTNNLRPLRGPTTPQGAPHSLETSALAHRVISSPLAHVTAYILPNAMHMELTALFSHLLLGLASDFFIFFPLTKIVYVVLVYHACYMSGLPPYPWFYHRNNNCRTIPLCNFEMCFSFACAWNRW